MSFKVEKNESSLCGWIIGSFDPDVSNPMRFISAMLGSLLLVLCLFFWMIFPKKPEPRPLPTNPQLFSQGDQVLIKIDNSEGVVTKVFYYSDPFESDGWNYKVRSKKTLDIHVFAEWELKKGDGRVAAVPQSP